MIRFFDDAVLCADGRRGFVDEERDTVVLKVRLSVAPRGVALSVVHQM